MDYEYQKGVLVPSKPRTADTREIATTADGRDVTRGFVDSLPLLPPLDPVLQSRGGDYRVYEELLRDDQVSACFRQLRLAVVGAEWKVDPGGDKRIDKKSAEFLKEQLDVVDFDRAFDKMLYGIHYGHGVAECLWGRDGAQTTLAKIKVRKARRFGFGPQGELKLLTMNNPLGELMPPRKFWTFTYGGDNDDDPYGIGLAHSLYWPVFFKRNGIKFWLIFLEKFGQPTAVGKYPANATVTEKKTLLNALGAVHTDGGIIVPDGMLIELLEAARSGTADYKELCDRMDNAIAKVILGQTATVQGTPGRLGDDSTQQDVAENLIKASSDLLCQSFNLGPARWLTEWNFPGAAPPKVWRQTEPDEDLNDQAERAERITKIGYRPTLQSVQDTYPGEWEPVPKGALPPDQAPGTEPGAEPAPEFAEDDGGAERPDQLTALIAQRADAEISAWVDQARDLIEHAGSLEEIRDGLLARSPDMGVDTFAELMQRAMAVSTVAGISDAADDADA